MSETLKNKLFNFETSPPEGSWEQILKALDNNLKSKGPSPSRKSKLKVFYTIAAAAVSLVFVFIAILQINRRNSVHESTAIDSINFQNAALAQNTKTHPKELTHQDAILRLPAEDHSLNSQDLHSKSGDIVAGGPERKNVKETAQLSNTENKASAPHSDKHTYIIIAGPTGLPVKVSSKIAALIGTSEDNSPEKLAWNKKVIEWKNAMNSTTMAPTTSNFLDIVELTNTLTDN